MTRAEIARAQALTVAADAEAVAAWDCGLMDVPPEVERELRALLSRSRRGDDWHRADDVTLIGADDDR